ncbi:MAG: hypothetical protein NVS9B3_10310 [Gemmatimonadaceae bacterium]
MIAERIRAGVATGLIAAAGTAGVLVGLGVRRGYFATYYTVLGASLVPGALEADPRAAIVGMFIHLATVVAWGLLFSAVAGHLRGGRLVIAGTVFSAIVYLANAHLLSPPLRLGFAGPVAPGEVVAFYVALAVALVAGTRLAF